MTTTPPHLHTTQQAYDAVAARYAELVRDVLDDFPLDRAILAAFAELTRSVGAGPVADLGCGPGYLTAHLAELGLDTFGIDLSPAMIDIACRTYPQLRFEVGSMAALNSADGALSGIVSWYSLIHVPPQEIPSYLAEFRRALSGDGTLLLGFFEAEGGPLSTFDHKVVTAYRWPIDDLAALAGEAGFAEVGRMLRQPHTDERFRRGHLLLRAR
ncbi:class I SAM-dependent methyltransferase [Saccharomonospora xinjiangensis]|uniref:class I SAM-dependent DNA methyltransferase n=1 Tax=Saccharomonospora xinjiangensis TaxID=75294 RepID=UPI00106F153C|nr:class I SAM-dependent methyltransferase [Saccharomonospora xinjiangensis]QBQ62134.1 Magnesium-protoporphyrin O-methyltransferase [Saccharomonospora xinjiangensis]